MNKHVKCFLKVLFSPLCLIWLCLAILLIGLVGAPLFISGCVKTDSFDDFMLGPIYWYRNL